MPNLAVGPTPLQGSDVQGKEKHVLREIKELFCFREFVVSSDPRSALQTAKKPFFLPRKGHLTS